MTILDDKAKAAEPQEEIDILVDAGFISKQPWWSLIGVNVEEQVPQLMVRASTGPDTRAL